MQPRFHRLPSLLVSVTILLAVSPARAQDDTTPKRLRSPATIRGLVGGESHDSYVIRARKGQTMTVRISWRREDDNKADFTVSESASFFGAEQVGFGTLSADSRRWTGRIPKSRDYYIYVVAHPTAHYTLRVSLK
ncbi:MAG TPA: hypothetical protein VGJ55_13275 [Pyrinomonadaceae bacterium]